MPFLKVNVIVQLEFELTSRPQSSFRDSSNYVKYDIRIFAFHLLYPETIV